MSSLRLMGAMASALLVVPVAAQGSDAPAAADQEFLEYLGSWEGDDADWIVLQAVPSKPVSPRPAERAPQVAEGTDQASGKVPQERMK